MFNSLFKADIIIKYKRKALEKARRGKLDLVIWTNGSKFD